MSHNRDGGRVNFLMAEAMSPYGKVYDDNGNYEQYPMYSETLFFNPMQYIDQDHERRQWNINLNAYAELDFGNIWKPLTGLRFKFNFGYSFVPKRESYYNGEAQFNTSGGYGYIFNAETQSYTSENILSYAKDIEKHHLDVTLLYASSRKKYHDSSASGSKFINDELSWHNLGGGSTQTAGSYSDLYTTVSQMGRLNYSYDSRYLFTFTVRRDGSSVFGDDNKYGVFPSVALGWNIANEKFMEKQDWLNNLKLRLSYGKAGNEAIGVYETLAKMSNNAITMDGSSATALYPSSRMGNSGLGWETTKTFNLGIDFGILNNRINGNIDFYTSTTTDLLLQRNLPKISGYSNVYMNMGETANKGADDRKYHVVLCLGKLHFLNTLTQALSEKFAGSYGIQTLQRLETVVTGVSLGIHPGKHPARSEATRSFSLSALCFFLYDEHRKNGKHNHQQNQTYIAEILGVRHKQHNSRDTEDDDRGAHVFCNK